MIKAAEARSSQLIFV